MRVNIVCEFCGTGQECCVCGRGIIITVDMLGVGNQPTKEIKIELDDASQVPIIEELVKQFNTVEDRWRIRH